MYRVGPATRAFAEVKFADNTYTDTQAAGAPNLDSNDIRYAVGAQWEATAKTTGRASLGTQERDYDVQDIALGRTDSSETFWDVGVTWQPTVIDSIDLNLNSDIADDFFNSGERLTRSYGIGWERQWVERFSTTVAYRLRKEDYQGYTVGGTTAPRDDENNAYYLRSSYQMRRWLNLGAEVSYEDNNSSLSGSTALTNFNYSRTTFLLTSTVTF
ncbi:MAG: outer membrane beta-barrel protein [Limnobacter sp.]|nr:outer membrane beta-barrel protein [Limnobacter sp.]